MNEIETNWETWGECFLAELISNMLMIDRSVFVGRIADAILLILLKHVWILLFRHLILCLTERFFYAAPFCLQVDQLL